MMCLVRFVPKRYAQCKCKKRLNIVPVVASVGLSVVISQYAVRHERGIMSVQNTQVFSHCQSFHGHHSEPRYIYCLGEFSRVVLGLETYCCSHGSSCHSIDRSLCRSRILHGIHSCTDRIHPILSRKQDY